MPPPVTRFAPSPTGRLHLGHAYSALFAWRAAEDAGGRFILRIEDIDATRCRPEFETAIYDDLAWLGLHWDKPVRRQSEHMAEYAAALDRLAARGLLYPCFCTRAEIRAEIARAGVAPHDAGPNGAEGPIYPGICRALSPAERETRLATGTPYALRLDAGKALGETGPLDWQDRERGTVRADPLSLGDVVLARKETPASYHLAVTLDDHLQGVTLVTRGDDLFAATHIHRLLQALLGLATPEYHHHRLIRDAAGARLAKRADAPTLESLRTAGRTPAVARRLVLDTGDG
ncbi:MAG: tRNA glutamyl-Q(34) synthetase GluQRS [Rhodospirillales bacterium]|nr:tRNA glutamyl-Q(34) synthetase GluQRS [Rhodospirillales bacterium]